MSNKIKAGVVGRKRTSPAVYSFKRVVTTYTGPAIQIRRSYDDALMDIGFDSAGLLDLESIYSFVGTASAYLTMWYDQMNLPDNSLYQPLLTQQPMIVSNNVAVSFQMPGQDTSGTGPTGSTGSTPPTQNWEWWWNRGKICKNLSKPITMNITEPANTFTIYDQQDYFQNFNNGIWQ